MRRLLHIPLLAVSAWIAGCTNYEVLNRFKVLEPIVDKEPANKLWDYTFEISEDNLPPKIAKAISAGEAFDFNGVHFRISDRERSLSNNAMLCIGELEGVKRRIRILHLTEKKLFLFIVISPSAE